MAENDLQDIFYDMGVKDTLPTNFDDFKQFVVKYCMVKHSHD
jgi:hypothetical protein